MKKLNNNGFAITSIIYSLLLLAIMLMTITIIALARKQILINNNKNKVYDKFTETYILNYNLNGGSGNISRQNVLKNTNVSITSVKPEKEGYLFKGWSKLNDSDKVIYSAEDVILMDSDITLYAVWEIIPLQYSLAATAASCGSCFSITDGLIRENAGGCIITVQFPSGGYTVTLNYKQIQGNKFVGISGNEKVFTVSEAELNETYNIVEAGHLTIANGAYPTTATITVTSTGEKVPFSN